jgi:hypothetical protein
MQDHILSGCGSWHEVGGAVLTGTGSGAAFLSGGLYGLAAGSNRELFLANGGVAGFSPAGGVTGASPALCECAIHPSACSVRPMAATVGDGPDLVTDRWCGVGVDGDPLREVTGLRSLTGGG